jgi:hypothetical protein
VDKIKDYAAVLSESAGVVVDVPGRPRLVIDLDACWAEIQKLPEEI